MILFIIAVLFSLALTLAVISARGIVAEVPSEDRQYMDPPPRFYRLTWPLVRITAYYCGWAVSDVASTKIQEALRRAGQDYTLTPVQFFAGKIVASFLFAIGAACIGSKVGMGALLGALSGLVLGFYMPELWLRDLTKARNLKILKALPFFLDVITMAVEAGMNLSSALSKSIEKVPPSPLVVEINRVLREIRGGKPRADALRDMAARLNFPVMNSFVSALVQGELMGASIGAILRAQSEQRRTERFQRAEKLALEAPVKMLGPLIMCIFPCTFIVIGFPIAMQLLHAGL